MAEIFKKIDRFLFNQVDTIKTHPEYLKVMEKLSGLDDQVKVIINQAISFILIFFPLIITLFIFIQNQKLKSHKEIKFDILSLSQYIIEQNRELDRSAGALATTSRASDQTSFTASFNNSLQAAGVNSSSFKIQSFNIIKTGLKVQKTQGEVSFTKVDLQTLTEAMKTLEKTLKARFEDFEATRSTDGSDLSGKFSLIVLGKNYGN